MTIWAIADLHLAKGVPSKHMSLFGPRWEHYMERIEEEWRRVVADGDLVLIPGDISWAMHLHEAAVDLAWIHALPGTKLLLRGNHDYWWQSLAKVQQILPPSCHLLQNNAFYWEKEGVAIGGSRLWDAPHISFNAAMPEGATFLISSQNSVERDKARSKPRGLAEEAMAKAIADEEDRSGKVAAERIPDEMMKIAPEGTSPPPPTEADTQESQKIYTRELLRLETSLKQLAPSAQRRIAITHYPPVGPALEPTPASLLLEKYGVEQCLFGHLHGVDLSHALFGTLNGIQYHLVAADALPNFTPHRLH